MTLSINGTPLTSTTTTINYTTTVSNCVVVLIIKYGSSTSPSVSGGGLTWIKRSSIQAASGAGMDTWYAIAASTLSNITITPSGYSVTRFTAFAVSGANTTTPFDVNGSLPATAANSFAASLSVTISTNNANCFLFSSFANVGASGFASLTPPTGFSNMVSTGTFQDLSYDIVSATQSSVTETYNNSTTTVVTMMVDAIQAAGVPYRPWMLQGEC